MNSNSNLRQPVVLWKTLESTLLMSLLLEMNGTTTFSVRAGIAVSIRSLFRLSSEDRFHNRPTKDMREE